MPHATHHYMTRWQKFLVVFIATGILMAGTAALASYMTRANLQAELHQEPATNRRHAPSHPPRQQLASTQPTCDDGNVVGYLAGGAAGGILGNQIGKGRGNTAATIGGTIGGAYVGGKYLPTRGVTCR